MIRALICPIIINAENNCRRLSSITVIYEIKERAETNVRRNVISSGVKVSRLSLIVPAVKSDFCGWIYFSYSRISPLVVLKDNSGPPPFTLALM